jgi:hypothetical protein
MVNGLLLVLMPSVADTDVDVDADADADVGRRGPAKQDNNHLISRFRSVHGSKRIR